MQKIESREKMHAYAEEVKKKLLLRKNKMQEIISSNEYILWLEKFTEKYSGFSDDSFSDKDKKITSIDLENSRNLSLLYEGISNYAKENYVYAKSDLKFGDYYVIKYNNIGYKIGAMSGQGTFFFCERTNEITDDFIDFNDIILNKKQKNTDYYNKRLLQLSSIISYYYEQGVPLQAIEKTIDDTLWQIKDNQDKSSKKILKKKI